MPKKILRLSALIGILLLTGLVMAACAGNENSANEKARPPAKSSDLSNYPRPAQTSGGEYLPGRVEDLRRDPERGEAGKLVFSSAEDTLLVMLCGMRVNCCTEKLRASFTLTDSGADVMLYEYLTDVCECFHYRDISFRVYPALEKGKTLRVFANDLDEVLAAEKVR